MVSPRDRPVVFDCDGERLVGIVHAAEGTTGVLMIVGGPQVRAGSHRLYVRQARLLTSLGLPTFRFDTRGMGDSSGEFPGFEHLTDDIAAALDAFGAACPQVARFVLWGLCDGASAALLYLHDRQDPRIAGLCLLNPWVRTRVTQARTQVRHYYRDRLRDLGFWKKLIGGRIAPSALQEGWRAWRMSRQRRADGPVAQETAFTDRMAAAWRRFDGPLLLVLSGQDYTAREFLEAARSGPAWRAALSRPGVSRIDLELADHTFSTTTGLRDLHEATRTWLRRCGLEPAAGTVAGG